MVTVADEVSNSEFTIDAATAAASVVLVQGERPCGASGRITLLTVTSHREDPVKLALRTEEEGAACF